MQKKKPNEISDWIAKIDDLQKRKVPTEVNYTKSMPDINGLSKVWSPQEENLFKKIPFPDGKMNISLQNYSKICCNMMDIPIHKNENKKSLIESLHCLFTVYSGFKSNIHFQKKNEKNKVF